MTAALHPALRVEAVSKQYRIYDRPGDRLKESLTRGRVRRHREFWALRDISFEVDPGTTVGIIGQNGCGKSTLLQIIAGTLEPTHGSVSHAGRVSALLELGAGFNMEFSGIENIFMNAALIGMSRREAEARLPQIERFAEIGDFIHQPVKTYSSGMYVRLAFAVAVSVEPQILVIDEALAVGDAVFQHRCIRRLKEMQEQGTTILFVSHDPGTVRALCNRALLLNNGRLVADGKPPDVLNRYQKIIMAREEEYEAVKDDTPHAHTSQHKSNETSNTNDAHETDETYSAQDASNADDAAQSTSITRSKAREQSPLSSTYRHGNRHAEVVAVEVFDDMRRPAQMIETGERMLLRMRVRAARDLKELVCGFVIRDRHGIHVYGTNTEQQDIKIGAASNAIAAGDVFEIVFSFHCWLAPGSYSVTVAAHTGDGESFDWLDGVLFFRVLSATAMDGIVNLNASVVARKISGKSNALTEQPTVVAAERDAPSGDGQTNVAQVKAHELIDQTDQNLTAPRAADSTSGL